LGGGGVTSKEKKNVACPGFLKGQRGEPAGGGDDVTRDTRHKKSLKREQEGREEKCCKQKTSCVTRKKAEGPNVNGEKTTGPRQKRGKVRGGWRENPARRLTTMWRREGETTGNSLNRGVPGWNWWSGGKMQKQKKP